MHKYNYKYKKGDIVNKLTIMDTVILCYNDYKIKGYTYKCNIDDYIGKISEYNLIKGKGCPVCVNKTIVKGINDIATTHPYLAEYFVNKEDIYKYSKSSGENVEVVCPNCGFAKFMTINNLYKKGFKCNNCSDKFSYPNKFISSMLNQLNIKYELETTFSWKKDKRYDVYIEEKNTIIENMGLQHYQDTSGMYKKTLEEEQENDKLKKQLAIKNNIKNYISIDCRKSELKFIKNNILNSKLAELFDLSNIDWLQCHEYACNTLVKTTCDLWNELYNKSVRDLSKKLKMSDTTIRKYLRQGHQLGWCIYDEKVEDMKVKKKLSDSMKKTFSKRVAVYSNNEKISEFDSLLELERVSQDIFGTKFNHSNVSAVCLEKIKLYKGYNFKYI